MASKASGMPHEDVSVAAKLRRIHQLLAPAAHAAEHAARAEQEASQAAAEVNRATFGAAMLRDTEAALQACATRAYAPGTNIPGLVTVFPSRDLVRYSCLDKFRGVVAADAALKDGASAFREHAGPALTDAGFSVTCNAHTGHCYVLTKSEDVPSFW